MSRNLSHQIKNLRIFELGKIFFSNGQDRQPMETEMLAGLWTGAREDMSWHEKPAPCDFYDLKGVVEDLLQCAGMDGLAFSQIPDADCSYTRAGHSARILHNQTPIGLVGEVAAEVLSAFNSRQPAFIFELQVPPILSSFEKIREFAPIPRFPFTNRDITLIVDNHVQAGDILAKVKLFGEDLMETIQIIDVYCGSPIPPGKRSISLRIVYRSHAETLSDQQVNLVHQQLTDRIIQKFNATLPV
jgi:phenylalanyl-tRNA synthetase beta chain